MAWTATVGESYQAGSNVMTAVTLVDGAGVRYVERFSNDGTARSLKRAVLAWIAKRDAATDALVCVPPGTTVTLDPEVAPPPPAPTADELLARDFAVAWRNVLVLEEANARAWGTVQQRNAVSNQLSTALTTAADLYTQKPAVCIPIMVRG